MYTRIPQKILLFAVWITGQLRYKLNYYFFPTNVRALIFFIRQYTYITREKYSKKARKYMSLFINNVFLAYKMRLYMYVMYFSKVS